MHTDIEGNIYRVPIARLGRARESAVTVQTSTRFFPVTVSSVADAAWRTSDEKQTLLTHPDAPCAVQQHEMVVS